MLPSIFPPFPDREEFDIFAVMEPAKEVGGDFYDFFMVDDRRLGIVIADVSGKGVPAALFMVITKTLIKNQAGVCATPSEVLETVNNKLMESNDLSLFVTAFMGILELDTGRFAYANAGHTSPLISRADGGYDWLKMESGFVLAGLENFRYETEEIVFHPGDRLVMYTDGITEALNPNEELFGNTRLFEALNRPGTADMPLETLISYIRGEVVAFASGAEQADDITVMAMSFNKVRGA
jgi:phosphoserine phosphatase RsbU/P